MQIQSLIFKPFYSPSLKSVGDIKPSNESCELVDAFVESFILPDEKINYSRFDEKGAAKIASYKELAINPVLDMLKKKDDEKSVTAGLYLLNRIIDAGAKNVGDTYPVISRFNYSKSQNIQVMLAGIYRKTLVPDAFGPLMTMFLKNFQNPTQIPFDPNEEVGGAILEYLRNNASVNNYSNILKN